MGILAAGMLAAGALLFAIPPPRLPLPECTFRLITGHSCLTCGMTRSLHAILHGEWVASMQFHLFGPAVGIAMLIGFVAFCAEMIRGRKIIVQIDRTVRKQVVVLFTASWLLYWGIRLFSEF